METAIERCCGILDVLGQTKMVVITPDELKRTLQPVIGECRGRAGNIGGNSLGC
jgi:hypothetical protein